MTDENVEQNVELVKLEDGATLNKFCSNKFVDLVANQEAIWDVIDVVNRLTSLEVLKNEDGLVVDVNLILPKSDDVLAIMAIKNFMDYHEIRKTSGLSPEETVEFRRLALEKKVRANTEEDK